MPYTCKLGYFKTRLYIPTKNKPQVEMLNMYGIIS